MKNVIFVCTLCLVLFGDCATAQIKKPGFTLGISAFYANPLADFKTQYRGGVGGEVKGGIGLGKTYFVASVGYAGFLAEQGNSDGTLLYMPVKLGIKQYFLARRLFINGDFGVAFLKNDQMASAEKRLASDIGFGVRLFGLEAGVYYDAWKNAKGIDGNTNTVLYKLGYNFTL